MIAVDANAIVALLIDAAELGSFGRAMYSQHDLAAPDLLPYEVTNTLRKLCRRQRLTIRAAEQALNDMSLLRLSTVPYENLGRRIWELRENVSAYDSAYVAVAEFFNVPLLTFDQRLQRAPGPTCEFVAV